MPLPGISRLRLDPADIVIGGLTIAGAAACYWLKGPESVVAALGFGLRLIVQILPILLVSLLMAAFVQVLVPREQVAAWLGRESGIRGLIVATVAGALVPGGPWTSFPLVYALAVAGADIGALVAFLSAWELISISRLIVWEIPFLGSEFVAIRTIASLPIPILAGMLARHIPLAIRPPAPR